MFDNSIKILYNEHTKGVIVGLLIGKPMPKVGRFTLGKPLPQVRRLKIQTGYRNISCFVYKGAKMGKNRTLKFYTVNEDYIEYLSQFDTHVSWNKEQKRPYVGIVLMVENYLYFAPLYSYKVGYDNYKDNPSFIRVQDRKGKNVSIIRFFEMLLVPETAIQLLDFNSRGEKYRELLQTESNFINDNKDVIYSKAKKVEDAEQNIKQLIELVKILNLKIGTKFDIRKAELLYSNNFA